MTIAEFPTTWEAARAALAAEFAPLSDHRASAAYRTAVAGNLLLKALHEVAGTPTGETRLVGLREAAA